MRLSLTLTLFLVAFATLRAEAPSLDGTMPEDCLPGLKPLLKEAVERSPTSISASITVAAAEAARYTYASSLWPQINGSADYQRETSGGNADTKSSTQSGLYYSASVVQPLFEWGAFKNSAAVGKLGEKIAQKQFAEAYRGLAVLIREEYLGLIGKKIQVRNALFTLKLAKEAQAASQARFDSGASSEAELGNSRISTEQAQLDADRTQEEYNYAKVGFTRLVGIDTLDEASIPEDLPHPEYSSPKADAILTGFVGGGIESTFQSQVYQMSIQQSDLNYAIAKVRLLPKVSAAASFNYTDQAQPVGNQIQQVNVESEVYKIEADWTIFDGFATKGAKLGALASKRATERAHQTYVDSMIDQMSTLRRQLGFSSRALSIAEVHYNLIEAEVKRVGDDKSLGYASQATVDSGILTLYSTGFQRAAARLDFWSRWTEFVSLAGVDPALDNISPRYVR